MKSPGVTLHPTPYNINFSQVAITPLKIQLLHRYPKTHWQVNFVEQTTGRFRFYLSGQKVRFEPTRIRKKPIAYTT
ncbi:MAG: hypothetical protein F6K36_10995 [Symploca sp. SIO3C6]|nr:hypothetical protein [Symploca sp. SIO3C6]